MDVIGQIDTGTVILVVSLAILAKLALKDIIDQIKK